MGRPVNERPKRLAKLLRRASGKAFNRQRHLLIRKMQLAINATRHEKIVRSLLAQLGIVNQFQRGFLAGGVLYVADFYLPHPYGLVLEIDGAHHQLDPVQAAKDSERDAYFRWRGFGVVRITNKEVECLSADSLLAKLRESASSIFI